MISVKYTTLTDGASARGNRIGKSLAALMALGLATTACSGNSRTADDGSMPDGDGGDGLANAASAEGAAHDADGVAISIEN